MWHTNDSKVVRVHFDSVSSMRGFTWFLISFARAPNLDSSEEKRSVSSYDLPTKRIMFEVLSMLMSRTQQTKLYFPAIRTVGHWTQRTTWKREMLARKRISFPRRFSDTWLCYKIVSRTVAFLCDMRHFLLHESLCFQRCVWRKLSFLPAGCTIVGVLGMVT